MAELNSSDHLVRLDKDTLANGYDNEAYHPHTEDEPPPSSDDERLRAENGSTPKSNGHATANPAPLNGTVVIDVDDANLDVSSNPNMDVKDSHRSNKPLDTRLHHYVPVDDVVDRKILNGSERRDVDVSDGERKILNGSGRTRKSGSNRESIALEDMRPPSYDGDDAKSEKAELEAELSNHNNGVSAYGESHFIGEKLNGKSAKSGGDESGKLPVNNHRKCLSRESSISSSSERKPTGEKLYFTEDNRKICPHIKRGVICGVIVVVISVVLLVCVLAATGIILSKSESTRYESGHSLPSMDSIAHAGHSFRPHPKQFLNTTVTTTVPPLTNDSSSHLQKIVPNALVGEFTIIDENFTDDLNDNSSRGYTNLARNLETELRRIFRENGGKFDTLKILNFRPGSIKVKFVVIWSSDKDIILSDRATEILSADLKHKNNSFYNFLPVDINSIHFINVFDECRSQKGGCSFDCTWNYDTLSKTCICPQKMYLLPDGKSCSLIPETSSTTTTTAASTTLEPALPTFPIEETTVSEIENITQRNGLSLVPLSKELVTTQSSFGETTTIVNEEITDFTTKLKTFPETTTPQPLSEVINTVTSPTHFTYTEEHAISNVEMSTYTDNENQTFHLSTEIPVTENVPTTKDSKAEVAPVFEDTTTEPTTFTTDNQETTITNSGTIDKLIPTVSSITIETLEETSTEPPFLETTTDRTSLKFPIVEPTTEVHTSNPNFEYTTENIDITLAPDTLPAKGDATEVTELPREIIYPVTFNENITAQPEMQTLEINGTEIEPVTTMNPYSEVNREGTLKEGETEFTTLNVNMDIDQTQPTISTGEMGYDTTLFATEISEIDHPTVPTILPKNETEEFSTETPEVLLTTSSFIPFSNRTSGMRFIDNFTDLYENITDNRYNTEKISTDSVTEQIDYVTEFPLSEDNTSIADVTTIYPGSETTFFNNDFIGTAAETKPTGESSIWIKKVDKAKEYTTQNNNLSTTETAMETDTAFMNLTTFGIENTTIPFEMPTNVGFSSEDEVYLEHKNDTLTLPPSFTKEYETTTTGLDIETTINVFPTIIESLVTIPQIIPQNNTEDLAVDTTLPPNDSTFFTNTESTTLQHFDEDNINTQETTNRYEMTNNYSEILTTTESYSLEDTTKINTFESNTATFPDLQNITDNPFLTESNVTDSTLLDLETTFTVHDIEMSNMSSGMELFTSTQATFQDTTLPIETTDSDIIAMETSNATAILDAETTAILDAETTAIFDAETSTNYPDESLLTNKSDGMTDVTTDSVLYTDSTNLNESTNTFFSNNYTQTVPSTLVDTDTLGNTNVSNINTEFPFMNSPQIYDTTLSSETESPVEFLNATDYLSNYTVGTETNETTTYTESPFILNITEEVTTIQAETSLVDGSVLEENSTTPYMETTTAMPISLETESLLTNDMNTTDVSTMMYNDTDTVLGAEEGTTFAPYFTENTTSIEENVTEVHYNWRNVANKQDENLTRDFGALPDHFNATDGNYTLDEDYGNYTSTGFEGLLNETTTNVSIGIVCREDQFICEPLNICLNYTFMCDGIQDCPDGIDEFSCQDSCGSNFRCSNSSNMCIMSQAHCDGIWDCENGTDEEKCAPTECAKHEVMCLDHSKCIRPSDICDLKYDCKDRSDEVGCVERTTCESGGRFFCNDGLCIPWSLKCDGEYDCKDKEDEGNCTCLNDEFQCNDGKCLKSSSRCDGHKDCHDADDEMGCVNVDSQHIVTTYEPYSGTWALLCAEDFNLDDGHYLCQELGFGHALKTEKLHVSFNGTWMAMRRENLTDASLWTERVSFVESCTSSSAAVVECQKFACGEYSGLLHRRKRDVLSSSSSSSATQWPFIGYTSTFNSNRGCMSEILTPIWLITSAECLLSINKEPYNGSDWYVRTNIGRGDDAGLAQNHEVLRIVSHPHSSKFRSLILRDYDVALVRLKHALVFVSDKIGAICPPEEQVPAGITCFSGVLGTQKPRAPPPIELTINSLALQIMERKNCNSVEHYNNQINQRMLCTQSSEGHTICDNDEGTPLMCLTGINKWFLAGMLTYQRYCEVYSKHPAVFSNLYAMRKFIDQVTGQKQYETSYDPNVYIIIPPTTPSPTVPETTTFMYTTTEALTTDLTTDFNYTVTGMFNESETDTTQGIEMSMSSMLQDENVTEPFSGRMEDETTVVLGGEELYTTTSSVDFTMESNVTETGEGGNSTSEDTSVHFNLNIPSNMTNDYDEMDNFTTLQPFTLFPDVNSTMLDDNSTLQGDFGFENASYNEPEMYERGLFNTSNMPNKTHDSIMLNLSTEIYPVYDNATEFYSDLSNATEQTLADAEETTVTLPGETENPFMNENATDFDVLNSTIDKDHVVPMSNETSFKAPERLTLTTLHPEFDGETTTSAIKMISPEMNATDFFLINETMAMDYNLTEMYDRELTTEATTDAVMKATQFELETSTEPSILVNEAETLTLMNATTESETQATEPTQHPILLTESESVLGNVTESPFMVGERKGPEVKFEAEKMRLIENPYLDNETATIYPNLENTTEPIDDLNMKTSTTTTLESETTGYTADVLTETTPNPDLMLTTMMPEDETLAFEADVDTDGDLSITLNGSDGNAVERVASLDDFGNFQEANSSRGYLARSRMIDDTSNSSGILFDFGNFNETDNFTLAGDMVLVDTDNSSGILYDSEHLNDSFYYIGLNDSLGIITENVSSSDVLENFEKNYNSNSTIVRSRMVEDGGNYSKIMHDFQPSNNSFTKITSTPNADGPTTKIDYDSVNKTLLVNITPLNNATESENATFPMELFEMDFRNDETENVTSVTPLIEYEGSVLNETMTHFRFATDELTIFSSNSCGRWIHSSNVSDDIPKPFFAEWPSLGYLEMGGQRCASSLISSHYLITSLKCLSSRDSEINATQWSYVGGVSDIDPSTVGQQVQEIIRHPNSSVPEFFNNTDLALVKLTKDVLIDDNSTDICLPKHRNSTFQECYVTGWKTDSSGNPEFFSQPVDITSQEICNSVDNYNGLLTNNFICATLKANLPTCEMDPGSSLYCLNSDQKWEIQGILTIRNPCDMKKPALFNSIFNSVQWISQTLSNDTLHAKWSTTFANIRLKPLEVL